MNRIREARKQAGIKQIDLCARLGISQGALSGWENGKYEPGSSGWLSLSEALGVSVDYLMGVTEEQKETPIPNSEDERNVVRTNNTVTNCIDLFKRFDNAVFSVCQTIKNELDCFCMGRHWRFDCHLLAAGWCVNDTAAVNANSFTKAFCLYSFCCHVD